MDSLICITCSLENNAFSVLYYVMFALLCYIDSRFFLPLEQSRTAPLGCHLATSRLREAARWQQNIFIIKFAYITSVYNIFVYVVFYTIYRIFVYIIFLYTIFVFKIYAKYNFCRRNACIRNICIKNICVHDFVYKIFVYIVFVSRVYRGL